ncbi:MAG: DUF4178 domain-containing protein [Gammaproteobacteria bacterium]|nr:DUF4178 domain-containing protein [Gammaproteobacteria bacterium]
MKYIKLLVCDHCKTSLFLEDEAVKHVGQKSAINAAPSIFELGRRYRYRAMTFETIGRIQFDYGDGFWDEWWVQSDSGEGKWLSVDEGDIAIETPVELSEVLGNNQTLPDCEQLHVGGKITLGKIQLEITEIDTAKCVGVAGLLPEVIFPDEEHSYAHCSGAKGQIYTLECFDVQKQLFKGSWIDPFDIELF